MAVTNNFANSTLELNGEVGLSQPTALVWGPDGRLYVTEVDGDVKVLTIDFGDPDLTDDDPAAQFYVSDSTTLTTIKDIQNYNDDGTLNADDDRQVTGIDVTKQFNEAGQQLFVAPNGTLTTDSDNGANPPAVTMYVTSSDSRIGAGGDGEDIDLDTNSGVITKLTQTGPDSWDAVDIVRGLSRSEENHATNGLEVIQEIDESTGTLISERLIVANGGNANTGAPSNNFAGQQEQPLSAAILEVDLDALNALPILDDNGRAYVLDLDTLNDPAQAGDTDLNDPHGGNDGFNSATLDYDDIVSIYSPGYRNAYDVEVTEDGRVWTYDNGANNSWGGRPIGEAGALDDDGNITINGVDDVTDLDQNDGYIATNLNNGEGNSGDDINLSNWNPANNDNFHEVTRSDDLDGRDLSVGGFETATTYIGPDGLEYVYGGHPNPTRAEGALAGLLYSPAGGNGDPLGTGTDNAFLLVSSENSYGDDGGRNPELKSDYERVIEFLESVEDDDTNFPGDGSTYGADTGDLTSKVIEVTPGVLYDLFAASDGSGVAVEIVGVSTFTPSDEGDDFDIYELQDGSLQAVAANATAPANSTLIEEDAVYIGDAGLPSDIADIVSFRNEVEGDYLEGGITDGALDSGKGSINGLAEYTSTILDEGDTKMSGAILATSFNGGNMIIMGRNEDGTMSSVTTSSGAQAEDRATLDVSGGPLGITTIGDDYAQLGLDQAFQGSIWTAVYKGNDQGSFSVFIEVSQPNNGAVTLAGQEIVDENDRDFDGIDKTLDPFEFDDENGYALDAGQKLVLDFNPSSTTFDGTLGGNTGFLGAALDGPGSADGALNEDGVPFHQAGATANQDAVTGIYLTDAGDNAAASSQEDGLYDLAGNIIPGGNAPIFQIKKVVPGTMVGSENTVRDAVHTGIRPSDDVKALNITLTMKNWIASVGSVADDQLTGLVFGDGTQSNFLRVVFGEVNGEPGIEIGYELGDANYQVLAAVAIPELTTALLSTIDLRLEIDKETFEVEVSYRVASSADLETTPFTDIPLNGGAGFSLPSGVLQDVLTGDHTIQGQTSGAAVGVVAETSEGNTLAAIDFNNLEIEAIGNEIEADTAAEVGTAGTTGLDTIVYTGTDTALDPLAADVENFDGSGSNADWAVQGNALDNIIEVGGGQNTVTTGEGSDKVIGDSSELDGTEITDFSVDDLVVIEDATLADAASATYQAGSAIMNINGIQLEFSGPDFESFDPANGPSIFQFEQTEEGLQVSLTPDETILYRVNAGSSNAGNGQGTIAAVDGGPDWIGDADLIGSTGPIVLSGNTGDTYTNGQTSVEDDIDFDNVDPLIVPWQVFVNERGDNSNDGTFLTYDFDVQEGVEYKIELFYTENWNNIFGFAAGDADNSRTFDVSVEGVVPAAFDNLNPLAEAVAFVDGAATLPANNSGAVATEDLFLGVARKAEYTYTAEDDTLTLEWLHELQNPKINAIQITQIGVAAPVPDTTAPVIESIIVENPQGDVDSIKSMTVVLTDDTGFSEADFSGLDGTEAVFTDIIPGSVSAPVVTLSADDTTATLVYTLGVPASGSWPDEAFGEVAFAAGTFQDAVGNTSAAANAAFVSAPFLDDLTGKGELALAINVGPTTNAVDGSLPGDDQNTYGGAITNDTILGIDLEADDPAYYSPSSKTASNIDGLLGATGANTDLDGSALHTYRDSSNGSFTATYPIENGIYVVELWFAELFHTTAGNRQGDYTINGEVVQENFDAFTAAGAADTPVSLTTTVVVTDGQIVVDVNDDTGQPGFNAIVVYDAIADDTPPTVSVADVSVSEGEDAIVAFTRIGDDSEDVLVTFEVVYDGAADASDITAPTEFTVTIPADFSTASITIPTIDDEDEEPAESFSVNIVSVSNTSADAIISDGAATVSIGASDGSIPAPQVPEGGAIFNLDFETDGDPLVEGGFDTLLGGVGALEAGKFSVSGGKLNVTSSDGDLNGEDDTENKNDFAKTTDLSDPTLNDIYITTQFENPFIGADFLSEDGVISNYVAQGIVVSVTDPTLAQDAGYYMKLVFGGNGGNAVQLYAEGEAGFGGTTLYQNEDGTPGAISTAAAAPFTLDDIFYVELSMKIDKAAGTVAEIVTFYNDQGAILGGTRDEATPGFLTVTPSAIPADILTALTTGEVLIGVESTDFGVEGTGGEFDATWDFLQVTSPQFVGADGTDSLDGELVNNGDFSEDAAAPTVLDFDLGSNVVQSTQQGESEEGGRDYDYYTFTVEEGQVLEAINVTSYSAGSGNAAFVGIVEGATFPAPPASDAEFPALAAQLLGGAIVDTSGADILADMASGSVFGQSTIGFDLPLEPGTYTIWHSQNGGQTTMELDFVVAEFTPPDYTLSVADAASVIEGGDTGATELSFEITSDVNALNGEVTVTFDAQIAGVDSLDQGQVVTFVNGVGTLVIQVPNDDVDDGDTTASVQLTGADNGGDLFAIDDVDPVANGVVTEDEGASSFVKGDIVLAINAGGPALTQGDIDFVAGTNGTNGAPFSGGTTFTDNNNGNGLQPVFDDTVFETEINGDSDGSFSFSADVDPSKQYFVDLYFGEIYTDAAGVRQFDVFVEGAVDPELDNFDVVATTGDADIPIVVPLNGPISPGENGAIDIDFTAIGFDRAKVSAVVIYEAVPVAVDGQVSIGDGSIVQEAGDEGTTPVFFLLTITGPDATVTVNYTLNGTPLSQVVEFVAGEATLDFIAANDDIDNGAETLDIALTSVTPAGFSLGASTSATAQVLEDDIVVGVAPNEDLDGDGLTNAEDDDVDGDGTANSDETFVYDATNAGQALEPGEVVRLEFDVDGTPFENGLTGALYSPSEPNSPEINLDNAEVSGGALNITATNGDHFNTNNTQENALVAAFSNDGGLSVETRFAMPDFDPGSEGDQLPANFQAAGVVIGFDQDNIVKAVFGRGAPEFQLVQDNGGSDVVTALPDGFDVSTVAEVSVRLETYVDSSGESPVAMAEAFFTFYDDAGNPIAEVTDFPAGSIILVDGLADAVLAGDPLGAGVLQTSTNSANGIANFDVSYQYLEVSAPVLPNDVDSDGVANGADPAAIDASNGLDNPLLKGGEILLDFDVVTDNVLDGTTGLTGVMTSPNVTPPADADDPYGTLTNEATTFTDGEYLNLTANTPDTFAVGGNLSNNAGQDNYQTLIDVSGTDTIRFELGYKNPFDEAPDQYKAAGLQIGSGDQDNFIKFVFGGETNSDDGKTRLELNHNQSIVGGGGSLYLNEIFPPDQLEELTGVTTYDEVVALIDDIVIALEVDRTDPAAITFSPYYEFKDAAGNTLAEGQFGDAPYSVISGSELEASLNGLNPNTGDAGGVAFGVIQTAYSANPPFPVQYDYLKATALDPITLDIQAVVDPVLETGDVGETIVVFELTASDNFNGTSSVTYSADGGGTFVTVDDLEFIDGLATLSVPVANDDVVTPDGLSVTITDVSNPLFVIGIDTGTSEVTEDDAAPVADVIPNQNAVETELFTFVLPAETFTDADTPELSLSAVLVPGDAALPEWLDFDPETGTFSGTAPLGQSADLEIKVIADDGANVPAEATFTLSVGAFNFPPEITPGNPLAISVDENTGAVLATYEATDPDAGPQPVSFVLGGLDAAAFDIDELGQLAFIGAPNYEAPTDDGGDNVYDITIQAFDGEKLSAATTLSVTVDDLDIETIIATTPEDLPTAAFGDVDEVETVEYSGSEDVAAYALPEGVENFDATGTGAVNVSGNSGDNTIGVGEGAADVVDLSSGGSDTVSGTAAELDGVSIDGFGLDDAVTIEGADPANVEITSVAGGSAIITVTVDDTPSQITIENLDGDALDPSSFLIASDENGGSVITLAQTTLRIQAEDGAFTGGYFEQPNGNADEFAVAALAPDQLSGTVSFDLGALSVAPGAYDITIAYFDETDGVGSIQVTLGDLDETITLDTSVGSTAPNIASFRLRTFEGVTIGDGASVLTLLGTQDGLNSLEPVRIDYIELTPSGDDPVVVNSPPIAIGDIADIAVNEGDPINIDVSNLFSDADEDPLTLELTGPDWLTLDNGVISGAPTAEDDTGAPAEFTLSASDEGDTPATISFTVDINTGPTSTDIETQSGTVGEAIADLDVNGAFSDVDDIDPLTLSLEGNLPPGVEFTDGVFSGVPTQGGAYSVTVVATDVGGLETSETFFFNIGSNDDRPSVVFEAEDFDGIVGSFPDGFYNETGNGSTYIRQYQSGSETTGEALYNIGGVDAGEYSVRVSYFDENDGVSTAQILLDVDGDGTFEEVGAWTFDDTTGGNAAQAQSLRTIVFTGLQVGPNSVLKIAGQSNLEEFVRIDKFELIPTGGGGVNFAPTVVGDGLVDVELAGIEAYSQSLATIFTDSEEDSLSFAVELISSTPEDADNWLAVSPEGVLEGTPVLPGEYTFFVTATDGPSASGQFAGSTFTIIVPDNNAAPVVDFNFGTQTLSELGAIEDVVVVFSDPEGGTVKYSLSETAPDWLSIDEDNGLITGSAPAGSAGDILIEVIGTDPAGASTTETFTLSVTNANDAPIAGPALLDQEAQFAEPFSFDLPADAFSDADICVDPNEKLTYSVELQGGGDVPSWLSIDPDTGQLSGVPTTTSDITVTIIATDVAGLSATSDLFIDIINDAETPDNETIQAEDFTGPSTNYEDAFLTNADGGFGAQLINQGQGALVTDLSEFNGNAYTLGVTYIDETDGVSNATAFVDGVEVGSWTWDASAGVQITPGGETGNYVQAGNFRYIEFDIPFIVAANSELSIVVNGDQTEFGRIDSVTLVGQAVNSPATVQLVNQIASLPEDTDTTVPVKVADIIIIDEPLGENTLSLDAATAEKFEIGGDAVNGFALFLKAGAVLDFESAPTLNATVFVDDIEVGATPDDQASMVLTITDVTEPEDQLVPGGDLDGDEIINSEDPDIDGDGILNADDPFKYDSIDDGHGVLLGTGEIIDLTFDKDSTDIGLSGFTGFLQGAAGGDEDTGATTVSDGKLIIDPITAGDTGTANNPDDDAQLGVRNSVFTIEADVINPWAGDAANPDSFDQMGVFFGLDSTNMVKMVFGQTAGVVEVQSQLDGVSAKTGPGDSNIALPTGASLDEFASVKMRMEVELTSTDPATGVVRTFMTFLDETGAPISPELTSVSFGELALTGTLAEALADPDAAVGVGVTHVDGGFGSPTNVDFVAEYDRFKVTEGIAVEVDETGPSLNVNVQTIETAEETLTVIITPVDNASDAVDMTLTGDEIIVTNGGAQLAVPSSSFTANANGTATYTFDAPVGGWSEPVNVNVVEGSFEDEAGNLNVAQEPTSVVIGGVALQLLESLTAADGIATGGSYADDAVGSATLDILAGSGDIEISNFGADSFTLTNTGDKNIAAVFIDFTDSVFADSVVDYDGSGGDIAAKTFAINTEGGTGAFFDATSEGAVNVNLADNDPNNDVYYLAGPDPLPNTTGAGETASGGYRGLLLKASTDNGGFETGESVGFSGDMDPNSIAGLTKSGDFGVDTGATNGWDVGGISGAEVSGSKFYVLFDDGTIATGVLASDGSQAGTIGEAVEGQESVPVSLTVNNGSGVYGLVEPTIVVTGDPGQQIQVALAKGFQPVNNDTGGTEALVEARLAQSNPDFQVNNAFDVQSIVLTIGADGTVTVPPGAFTYSSSVSGVNFEGDDIAPIAIQAVAVNEAGFAIGDVEREYLTNPTEEPVVDVVPEAPGYFELTGDPDGDAYYKIQIEDAAALNGGIAPNGKWNYETEADEEGRQSGFQGSGYYSYGSNTSTGINGVAVAEILEFVIDVPEELVGEELTFRLRASRDGEAESDQQNDVWFNVIKEDGTGTVDEFLVGNGGNEPEPTSSGFIKVFGGPNDGSWGYATGVDGEPGNFPATIEFDEAGKYVLQIAGRSQGFHIDWIELYTGSAPGTGSANSTFVATGPQPVQLINEIPDQTFADGVSDSYQVPSNAFNDPNDDPISYSLAITGANGSITTGVSIDETTGLISGLSTLPIDTYTAIVTATTIDGTATDTFEIDIVDEILVQTIEVSVSQASDDYEQFGGGGSQDLELGLNGVLQSVGVRFTDITIPAGATITDAYIEFEAFENNSAGANFDIGIQDSENAATFTTADDLVGRTIASTADWSNVEAWTDGEIYRTPNLASLIEDVIGGDGISGGDLAFIIDGDGSRVAHTFNSPGAAPKLVIEFGSTGGGDNTPPAASSFSATIGEGATTIISVDDLATDTDGDDLTIVAVSATSGTPTITDDGKTITFVAGADDATITYTVSDGEASVGGSATITVEDIPNVGPTGDQLDVVVEAGEAILIDLNNAFTDPDGGPQALQFELSGDDLPTGLTFVDGVLSGSTSEVDTFDFNIGVSDGDLSAFDSFSLTVEEPVVGESDIVLTLFNPNTEANLGALDNNDTIDPSQLPGQYALLVEYTGSGADDSVTFQVDGSVIKTENVEPYSRFGDAGFDDLFGGALPSAGETLTFDVVVHSGPNGTGTELARETYNLVITEDGGTSNLAPVVTSPIADIEIDGGQSIDIDLDSVFDDPDNGPQASLSYSVSGAPSGVSIQNGSLVGTPPNSTQDYTVTVTASDGQFSVSDVFEIAVEGPPPSTGENLLVNGDFEDNPITDNSFGFFDDIPGWVAILDQIEIQELAGDFGTPAGNAVVELATSVNAGIEQTFTVETGGTFTLALEHASRFNDPALGDNGFQVLVDGVVLDTVSSSNPGTVADYTLGLDLDAGEHTIGFIGLGQNDGFGAMLDNVEIVANSAAASFATQLVQDDSFDFEELPEGETAETEQIQLAFSSSEEEGPAAPVVEPTSPDDDPFDFGAFVDDGALI